MHPRHGTLWRAAAAMAMALAVCTAFAARPDDRTPLLKTLDSLFYAGRYDTLRAILPGIMRGAEASGDSASLGRLAFQLGRVEITLGHQAVAGGLFDRAIRLTEAARDTVGLLPALHFKAFVLRDSGNPDAAMALFERERDLGHRAGVVMGEANAILNLAYRDLRRGDLEKAKAGYDRAHRLFLRTGSQYAMGSLASNMGMLHRALGDFDSSRYWYGESLRIGRTHGYPMHELWGLSNLGELEANAGNLESAATYHQAALEIGRRIGFDRGQALPLRNIALVWSYLGENDKAQRALDDAIEVCHRAGFTDLELANTNALGALKLEAGRNHEAAMLFRRVVNQPFVFNRTQLSEAAYGLALALADMDSVRHAIDVLAPYVTPRVATPDFTVQPYLELAYAGMLCRLQYFDEALARSVAIRDEMDRTGRTDLGVAARLLESSCRRRLGDAASAAGALATALDSLEVARAGVGDAEFREAYGHHVIAEVIEGCRVMLEYPPDAPRTDRVSRFYETLRRFKTRTLLERIRHPHGGEAAPLGGALTRSLTLEQLQRDVLQPDELLLDMFVSGDETYLFAVSSDSCRMVSLPGGRSRLTEQVLLYSDLLSAADGAIREQYPAQRLAGMQQTLGSAVLGPVSDLVASARCLVVAPDGFFASIPFGTLMLDENTMLMERVDVVEVPSASVLDWARSRTAHIRAATSLLAVDGGAARGLEGARHEVRALQRRYANVNVVPAGPGVLDTLAHRAGAGRILHVAAHARVNDDSPWQSGFVLESDTSGAPAAPTLRAWEIARTRLPYEMGVLAGCETAGGRATNGEGVLGLTSAFLSAGVPVVVSSRWPVDDRVTVVLMQHFYDGLAAGKSVASALRVAQLAVRSNRHTTHPFYWAGFAVIGDGSRVLPPVARRARTGLWITVAGTGFLAGLAGWTWRRRRSPSRAPA